MNLAGERAFGDYVKLALSAVAPGLSFEIVPASNAPLPELGSAQLRMPNTSTDEALAAPYTLRQRPPEHPGKLVERVVERGTLAADLEIRLLDPGSARAAYLLARSLRRVLARERLTERLAANNLGLVAVSDPIDVSAFVREVEWESRAQLTITVAWVVVEDSLIDAIDAVEISGTLTAEPDDDAPPIIVIDTEE